MSERRRRRPRRRLALGGAALALVALFVVPAFGPPAPPSGAGFDDDMLVTGAQPSPTPTEAPAEAPEPTPAAPVPTEAPTLPVAVNPGRPPSRLAAELTGTKAPSVDLLSGYQWPLAHPRITQPFGPAAFGSTMVHGKPFHDGIDLATFCGDRVRAAHSGRVIAAGRHFDDLIGWVGDLEPYYRRL